MKNNINSYKLREYEETDYNNVVNEVVSPKYLKKYLNKGLILSTLCFLKLYKSDFYILEDEPGNIVASGVLRIKFNFKKFRRDYWIYGIEVKKNLRGCGIGKILMKELLSELKQKNIESVYLSVATKNEIALNLYYNLGFKRHSDTLDKYILKLNLNE